jgi:hypothetical protein
MTPKPGIITTEFWMTMIVHASGLTLAMLGKIDAQWAIAASAIVQAVYTWGRSFIKDPEIK